MTSSMRACGADALPAHGDQRRRPGDAVGELVDVDIAGLQLGEDPFQLGEGAGVAGLAGGVVAGPSVIVRSPRCGRAPCCAGDRRRTASPGRRPQRRLRAHDRPTSATRDRPAAPEHGHRVERPRPGGEGVDVTLLGVEQLHRPGEQPGRRQRRSGGRRRRADGPRRRRNVAARDANPSSALPTAAWCAGRCDGPDHRGVARHHRGARGPARPRCRSSSFGAAEVVAGGLHEELGAGRRRLERAVGDLVGDARSTSWPRPVRTGTAAVAMAMAIASASNTASSLRAPPPADDDNGVETATGQQLDALGDHRHGGDLPGRGRRTR